MNRAKKATRNSIFAILTQVASLIYGLLVPRLVLSHYGSELNGLVSSINQFIQYFTLLESGLASAAIYSLFKPLEDNDEQTCAEIVSDCDYEYKKIGFIFVGLAFALALIFPHFKNAEGLSTVECSLLVLAISINTGISYFIFGKYRALLTAAQYQHILSIISMLNMVVITIAVVICVNVINTPIWIMKAVSAAVPLLQLPMLMIYTRQKYPWIRKCKTKRYGRIKNRYVAFGNEIMGVIFTSSPIVLLTTFVSLSQVSVYSVYNTIYHGIATLFGSVNLAFASMFGSLVANGNNDETAHTYKQFESIFYHLSSFTYSCCYVLTLPFLAFYTRGISDVEYLVPLYAFLFSLNGWFSNAYTPQAVMIRAGGLFKETRFQIYAQTTIGVILGIGFTSKWGISGLLLSQIIANAVRMIMAIKTIDFDTGYLDKKNAIIHLCLSGFQMFVSILFSQFVLEIMKIAEPTTSLVRWFLQAIITAIVSAVIMILFILLTDKDSISFIKRITKSKKCKE